MAEIDNSHRKPRSEPKPERRLHQVAMQVAGSLALRDPDLSTRVREKVCEKLERRRGESHTPSLPDTSQ